MACWGGGRSKRKSKTVVFVLGFVFAPSSFAEFWAIDRANPPGKADLVLCARTAHQDGRVGNSPEFRQPECFFRGKRCGAAFLVTFLAVEKSNSPAGRDPQGPRKQKSKCYCTYPQLNQNRGTRFFSISICFTPIRAYVKIFQKVFFRSYWKTKLKPTPIQPLLYAKVRV